MQANISTDASASLADIFRLLGQPVRIRILLTIADGEACVCHIEAVLGTRQAVISQHLMVLRDAGLVTTTREGRNIFYRLANPKLLHAIRQVAEAAGLSSADLARLASRPAPNCPCPLCNPNSDPELSCKKLKAIPTSHTQ